MLLTCTTAIQSLRCSCTAGVVCAWPHSHLGICFVIMALALLSCPLSAEDLLLLPQNYMCSPCPKEKTSILNQTKGTITSARLENATR